MTTLDDLDAHRTFFDTYAAIAPSVADALGYAKITNGYEPEEKWMLDAALAQLGPNIDYHVVRTRNGIEIWRVKREVDVFETELSLLNWGRK